MGLFDKFKSSDSDLPKDIENLLNIILEDGNITDQERNVLYSKAEKYGISADELDIIINHRISKIEKKEQISESQVEEKEVDDIISKSRYSSSDSIVVMFKKYNALNNILQLNLSKFQVEKVYAAKSVFVNSICLPENREKILELITTAMPFAKTTAISGFVKGLTDIGFGAVKTFGVVGKVATLGLASDVIDQAEKFTKKVIVSSDAEIANLWKSKLIQMIKDAKKAIKGGIFLSDDDKNYSEHLKTLEKQLEKQ